MTKYRHLYIQYAGEHMGNKSLVQSNIYTLGERTYYIILTNK